MEKIEDFVKVVKRSGSGSGSGFGSGDGSGYGLKTFNKQTVYMIDGVQTLLYKIVKGIAKGAILNSDLTLTPCYIMKHENVFAHGETIHEAQQALQDKLFEELGTEERIDLFLKTFNLTDKYSGRLFFDWHNKLTGSCEMGRKSFIADRGLDIDAEYTVSEFISICENAFGSNVIQALKERIKQGE